MNVSPEGKDTLPPKDQVYSSIEGLIQHFELIMTNRGFEAPRGEVYNCIESANGELGYYVVSAGENVPWRVRTRPPCYINYSDLPQADRRPHDQRRGGGARQHQRHRGGVGSVGEVGPFAYGSPHERTPSSQLLNQEPFVPSMREQDEWQRTGTWELLQSTPLCAVPNRADSAYATLRRNQSGST